MFLAFRILKNINIKLGDFSKARSLAFSQLLIGNENIFKMLNFYAYSLISYQMQRLLGFLISNSLHEFVRNIPSMVLVRSTIIPLTA